MSLIEKAGSYNQKGLKKPNLWDKLIAFFKPKKKEKEADKK